MQSRYGGRVKKNVFISHHKFHPLYTHYAFESEQLSIYPGDVSAIGKERKIKKIILLNIVFLLLTSGVVTAGMRKGPYLIYPGDNTQMTVLWQMDSYKTCTLEWGLDMSYSMGSVVSAEFGDHQHKHTITGLAPATRYYYRVREGVSSGAYHSGTFFTAIAVDAEDVKFLAYGDTRSNPSIHDRVNQAMIETFEADPNYQSLTLHSGDWVSNGDSESDWTSQFFGITQFNTREMLANLPINGCKGNHEGSGALFKKYWPYPYVSSFYWSFDYGPAHFAVVDQYTSYSTGSAQHTWLTNDLAWTDKEWKFIILHAPGYSAGGSHSDNTDVRNYIQPLCEMYGVDIVFAGHNHYYARCDKNGVKHITTGGGGAPLYTPSPYYSPYVETCEAANHFCKIDIQGQILFFEAVKPDGTLIDEFTLIHPNDLIINLVGPADGATVDENGAVLSCEAIEGVVSYQLLLGPSPDNMEYVISDTALPPTEVISEFPYEDTYWTIRVRDAWITTETADARLIHGPTAVWGVRVLQVPQPFQSIQAGVDAAKEGDSVEVLPETYYENIIIKGLGITVTSVDRNDPAIVAATVIDGGNSGSGSVVTFANGEGQDAVLTGFTITGGNNGIYCTGASSAISNCTITENGADGIYSYRSDLTISNCVIAGNTGYGIFYEGYSPARPSYRPTITNCTISENVGGGIYYSYYGFDIRISNCIFRGNPTSTIVGLAVITYSDIEGGWPGIGNIDADPLFADATNGDYHLRSEAGRWDLNSQTWVQDGVTSPCIDAGNPGCAPGDEPNDPNNVRINMGAYGGTAQASMSPYDWGILADLTNDNRVDSNDLAAFIGYWLDSGLCIPGDLDLSGSVDFADFALMALQWLEEK